MIKIIFNYKYLYKIMLKPLLRTIPTLSGNVKLACHVSDIQKVSKNEYVGYVKDAMLFPLSSQLSQQRIDANMLYSSYDYDLARFYSKYSEYFFENCFEYNKKDYEVLDIYKEQKQRNIDFEFGCKRISYRKNEYQFAFYAPIYIESIKDIPDYFLIDFEIENKFYSVHKKVKIMINDDYKYNYLGYYLKTYLNKLDSNVIYCRPSLNQITYYGIDLAHGGFVKSVDNIGGKNFIKQQTIDCFDSILTSGFKRNKLAIRQILPLSFYFNINDFLDKNEVNKYSNSRVKIEGKWYKDSKECDFYDLSLDYYNFAQHPYMINPISGRFEYDMNSKNILSLPFPSLNENKYINYRYSNKINKRYNRWKLKYSSDENPYIINLSPAFSMNQKSMYKYGTFPEYYKNIPIISDNKLNINLPIGKNIKNSNLYKENKTLISKYEYILNNCLNWYSLISDDENIYSKDIWKDVEDNKVFYKGILYDLNRIYDSYNIKERIDKFSVIVKANIENIPEDELSNIHLADVCIFNNPIYENISNQYCNVNNSINGNLINGNSIEIKNLYNITKGSEIGTSKISSKKLFIKNPEGEFIDLINYLKDNNDIDLYDINKYYKVNDIVKVLSEYSVSNINYKFLFNTYNHLSVDANEFLPIYYLSQVVDENDIDILFEHYRNTSWILENLRFSTNTNMNKLQYNLETIRDLIKSHKYDKLQTILYLKSKFLSASNLERIIQEESLEISQEVKEMIENLPVYRYLPMVSDISGNPIATDTFIRDFNSVNYGIKYNGNEDKDLIYIDTYNLSNIDIPVEQSNIKELFARFLNLEHLIKYIDELYKDKNGTENEENIVDSIYIKKRVFVNDSEYEVLDTKDFYYPIYYFYDPYIKLNLEDKIYILNNSVSDFEEIFERHGICHKKDNVYSKESYSKIDYSNNTTDDYHDDELGYFFKPVFYYNDEGNYIELSKYVKSKLIENNNSTIDESYEYIKINSLSQLKTEINNQKDFGEQLLYITLDDGNSFIPQSVEDIDIDNITAEELETYYVKHILIDNKKNKYAISDSALKYITNDTVSIIEQPELSRNILNRNISDTTEWNNYKKLLNSNIQIPDSLIYGKYVSSNGKIVEEVEKNSEKIEIDIFNAINISREYINDNELNNSVYYKVWNYNSETNSFDEEYIKYDFKGVQDFVQLDKEHAHDTAIAILKDKVKIDTYIIDEHGNYILQSYIDDDNYYVNLLDIKETIDNLPEELNHFKTDLAAFNKQVVYSIISNLKYNPGENYWEFNDLYNYNHDLDNLLDIQEVNSKYHSNCKIDAVFKKEFLKLDKAIFDKINLDFKSSDPYLDLYLYRFLTPEEYSKNMKFYYSLEDDFVESARIGECLYPIFDDIYVQDRKYSAIYYDYTQGKVVECVGDNNIFYRYNSFDTPIMYDISSLSEEVPSSENYRYSLIDSCSSELINESDYLSIFNTFGINTYKDSRSGKIYGYIYIDANLNNTSQSINIVDRQLRKNKYCRYINGKDIYSEEYNFNEIFERLEPFTYLNLIKYLYNLNGIMVKPFNFNFDLYYRQYPLLSSNGEIYAYDIKKHKNLIDKITLQRYFDSIVPYITSTNKIYNSYNLIFKDIDKAFGITYTNDVFKRKDLNIYRYSPISVSTSEGKSYDFYPTEYKHFNDNHLINLSEEIKIKVNGKHTYDEILRLEKDEEVFNTFKNHILSDIKNEFNEDEILFLYKKYRVEYDTNCIGLNASKTNKLYTLTYKFILL